MNEQQPTDKELHQRPPKGNGVSLMVLSIAVAFVLALMAGFYVHLKNQKKKIQAKDGALLNLKAPQSGTDLSSHFIAFENK